MPSGCSLASPSLCPASLQLVCLLSALYPNLEELGDYMGLSLNSDEVQKNLALVPLADNVSVFMWNICEQKPSEHS